MILDKIIMENKMLFGNCLELMCDIPDKSINLILADLPYATTNCHWDNIIPLNDYINVNITKKKISQLTYDEFSLFMFRKNMGNAIDEMWKNESKIGLWSHYERIIKDNGAIILTAQSPFDKILGSSNPKLFRYEWIWEKTQATGHLNAKKMPMKAHENVLVFYKKLPTYNPIMTEGHVRKVSTAHHKRNTSTGDIYGKCDDFVDYDSTERYPRSVVKFASDKQKLNLHSTQKPVALFKYIIETYSNEGDIVLDNCAGSFTTGVAALETNRRFILMENDKKIFEDGKNRVLNFINQLT